MKKITLLILFTCLLYKTEAQETIIYYDDFRFANNSGFQGFVTSNPDGLAVGDIIIRNTDLPDETTVLGYTRPTNNFGDRTDARDQRHVSLVGHISNDNYTATSWVVTDPVDISTSSNMVITFALRNRFRNDDGDADPNFKILIATNYTITTDPTTVIWTDITSQVFRVSNNSVFESNPNWNLFYYNATSQIASTGSDKFALAFQYESFKGVNAFSGTNRNGNWFISDVKYAENSAVLSTNNEEFDNNISIYPNPVSDILEIDIANNVNVKNISLVNVLGKTVYTNTSIEAIDVSNHAKGLYILRITDSNNLVSTKKVIVE